ncbi:S8 family peptidase [Desulfofundulus sp. TPOSR]|uniref:S8 family peptidase n=1 Tax=Desulfofundulus sp. TPOSR TaxID=2714340 RepID=UPI00140BA145|nr:S8 family peptidase [Desulfofundulus sp. TPOSR]NHM28152.1 S8 family peptidase [Desulfofundulus sp. TPOSR]
MNKNDRKPHLWIPDEEVVRLEHNPTGRDRPRNIIPSEHGKKLSSALENIITYYKNLPQKGTLSDELYIFKVLLPDEEKIDNKKRRDFLKNNGLRLNVVKNKRTALVSTTPELFQRLRNRIENYKSHGKYSDFQYIDSFEPFTVSDKQSSSVRRLFFQGEKPPKTVDIQLLLVPNLDQSIYEKALPKLKESITHANGRVVEDYYLSDGTPVIRAIVPSMALEKLSLDDAIYRVEETRFFSVIKENSMVSLDDKFKLNPEIDIDNLPIVVILDTGINLPAPLNQLIVARWIPDGAVITGDPHGTQVASRAIFGDNLGQQVKAGILTPRVRVVDAVVLDGEVPENVFIKRLQKAINELSEMSKIFNLSANAKCPIDGDEMSIIGYELDNLMQLYNVQFVISSGNHYVWRTASTLEDVLDDDDSRIAAPGDSMLGIVVGAVVAGEHTGSISKANEIAPYSRKGPGFAGFPKPDIVAYSGTICLSRNGPEVPIDLKSIVLMPTGELIPEAGTSFAAPVVAGDLAVIASQIPGGDILLAKALLYHGAIPLWDEEGLQPEEEEYIAYLYGKGLSNSLRSISSTSSRVTFVRTGELNRLTKERVKFWMPSILAAKPGRNTAKVTVTCVTKPPLDRTKGTEYLGAYISASLHKVGSNLRLLLANPSGGNGRWKWDSCHHFYNTFSRFNSGEWQVWLQLHTRWDVPDDFNVPYALAITIEDLSGELDIYNEVLSEAQGRFIPLTTIQVPVVGSI